MREFNKSIEVSTYTIEETNGEDLGVETYGKVVEDLTNFIKVEDGYKLKTLDLFASNSSLYPNIPEWMDYKSCDYCPSYKISANENIAIDIDADPNNLPINPNSYDMVFVIGSKFGYGSNHQSLPEIERIIKPGGLLIASLSKFWYFKEINQLITASRNCWEYLKSVEVQYKIVETGVESSKYFTYYRYQE